ncbi:MAG: WG repeat-containing protein [Cytophagales bacterium]|nr:WG repeat-containing protein [Cytophagales bacterium]
MKNCLLCILTLICTRIFAQTDSLIAVNEKNIPQPAIATPHMQDHDTFIKYAKKNIKSGTNMLLRYIPDSGWVVYNSRYARVSGKYYHKVNFFKNAIALKKHYWEILDFSLQSIKPALYVEIKSEGTLLLGKQAPMQILRDSALTNMSDTIYSESVAFMAPNILRYTVNNKHGLYNTHTQKYITEPIYTGIEPINNEYYGIKTDKLTGVMNAQGKIIIQPFYDVIQWEPDGYFKIINITYQNFKDIKNIKVENRFYGLASKEGEVLINPQYADMGSCAQNRVPVLKNDHWAYCDYRGNMVTDFYFKNAQKFENGLAKVTKGFYSALIDTAGKWVLYPEYAKIQRISNGKVLWSKSSKAGFYDVKNKSNTGKIWDEIQPIEEGYYICYANGLAGLLDSNLNLVINPSYTGFKIYNDENCIVASKGYFYSIMHMNGNLKVYMDYPFHRFERYKEGLAMVVQRGKYGFIDNMGQIMISTQYDEARPFSQGIAAININGRWGYIDKNEKILVTPYYDDVTDFYHYTAIVTKNKKYGFVNREGQEVTKTQFEEVKPTAYGNFIVKQGSKYGLVNDKGLECANAIYRDVVELKKGVLKIRYVSKYGLVTINNKIIVPQIYEDIQYDTTASKYIFTEKYEWGIVR